MTHDIDLLSRSPGPSCSARGSVRERYTRGLQEEISAELARCLDPFVHEQDIRGT